MSTVSTKKRLHLTHVPQFIHLNKANSDTIYSCISVDRCKEFEIMVIHHDESKIISNSVMKKSQQTFAGVIFESKQKFFLVLKTMDEDVLDIDVEIQYSS
jgi:hypothetical protein